MSPYTLFPLAFRRVYVVNFCVVQITLCVLMVFSFNVMSINNGLQNRIFNFNFEFMICLIPMTLIEKTIKNIVKNIQRSSWHTKFNDIKRQMGIQYLLFSSIQIKYKSLCTLQQTFNYPTVQCKSRH